MPLGSTLDVDLVALATAGEVAVLLDLAAPPSARPLRGPQVGSHVLEQVAQAVSLVIRPALGVPAFTIWNDLPVSGVGNDILVELGDFHAGEQRRILLSFEVPGVPELDSTTICELEVRWVDAVSRTENVATLPVPGSRPR
jgi:hypothetical protein